MTPGDFAMGAGYDAHDIEATARLGAPARGAAYLREVGVSPEALVAWCRERASEAAEQRRNRAALYRTARRGGRRS